MSLSSMSRNPASAIVRRAVLAVAAFGAACSDHIPSAPARVPGSSDRVVTCQGDVAARTLSCGMSSAPAPVGSPPGFSADLIVGGENIDVLLKSTNVSYDPATQIFQADVTVQNLLTPTLGTPDGNAVSGVKVFFHAGPSVVSGSGAVTVANADGAGTFTGTNQPYFLYGQTLPTGQVSAAKTWQWAVPATVGRFVFDVLAHHDQDLCDTGRHRHERHGGRLLDVRLWQRRVAPAKCPELHGAERLLHLRSGRLRRERLQAERHHRRCVHGMLRPDRRRRRIRGGRQQPSRNVEEFARSP